MDTELLDKLLAVGGQLRPQTFKADGEPNHVYYRRNEDGTIEKVFAEPSPRKHTAADLGTLAELAGAADAGAGGAEVWYSRHGITLYLDKSERRNVVTMPLDLSPQVLRLMKLEESRPAFQQSALIKELRITFAGCLGPAGNLIEVLRRVKFNATQASEQLVEHGRASLGKQITAQVTGTGVLPEDFSLDVPVFANPAFAHIRQPIQVALEPDAATCTFQLIPFPGKVEMAVWAGEEEIGDDLRTALAAKKLKDLVPVYYGKA